MWPRRWFTCTRPRTSVTLEKLRNSKLRAALRRRSRHVAQADRSMTRRDHGDVVEVRFEVVFEQQRLIRIVFDDEDAFDVRAPTQSGSPTLLHRRLHRRSISMARRPLSCETLCQPERAGRM